MTYESTHRICSTYVTRARIYAHPCPKMPSHLARPSPHTTKEQTQKLHHTLQTPKKSSYSPTAQINFILSHPSILSPALDKLLHPSLSCAEDPTCRPRHAHHGGEGHLDVASTYSMRIMGVTCGRPCLTGVCFDPKQTRLSAPSTNQPCFSAYGQEAPRRNLHFAATLSSDWFVRGT